MYTFLIFAGAVIVIYGMKLRMSETKSPDNKLVDADEFTYSIIPEEDIIEIEDEPSFSALFEIELEKQPEPLEKLEGLDEERRRLIEGFEREEYSLEMVCSMLNMEKGEVLLLKNIYKNYQK
jgi:hypothetical protein